LSKIEALIRLLEDVRYRNKYRKSTDRYKSELQKTYEEWYRSLAGKLAREKSEAKRKRLADAAMLALLIDLKKLGRERLEEAYMQSIEAVDITPEMVDEMELIIASNDEYLTDSLIPALGERIEKNVTPEIWFAGLAAILGAFAGFTARVGLYAGAYWDAIWRGAAQQQVIQGREGWAVLWLKDPRAKHCSSCLEFAGAYIHYDAMLVVTGGIVPGVGTICDGNCRCTLLTRSGPEMEWVVMGSGGVTESMREGGPGSGHRGHVGRPGAVGGSMSGASAKKIRLTRHAFNRTKERTGFGPVRRALKALSRIEVPEKEWHTELYRSRGRLAGYLQGFDGRVKTVLGPWYSKGKLSGEEITWQGGAR